MTASEIRNIKLEKRLLAKHPCMYTPEEIWSGADQVINAYREGNKEEFVPFEKVKRKEFP